MAEVEVVTLDVVDGESGDRVDAILARRTGIARSKLVATGVRVDGAPARLKDRVASGAVIEATVAAPAAPAPQAAEVDFEVVLEDDDLVVVDKPAGVAVHAPPGRATSTTSLVNGLLLRYPEIADLAEADAPERPGVVHRLDRDTSGLLVLARSPAALAGLRRMVEARVMRREYAAVVTGAFDVPSGEVDAPIGRRPGSRTFSVRADGRPARTRYELVAGWERPTLSALRVWLDTGRTHQIRVHLAAIGHPVLGDRAYRGSAAHGAERQFLHSHALAFTHPCTGAAVEAVAPLPEDLRSVLVAAGHPVVGGLPEAWLRTAGSGG